MMIVDNKFEIGQIVYLKTDEDQLQRIITSIQVNKYDIIYTLTCGVTSSGHYDYEISDKKNVLVDV